MADLDRPGSREKDLADLAHVVHGHVGADPDDRLVCVSSDHYTTLSRPGRAEFAPGVHLSRLRWDEYGRHVKSLGLQHGLCRPLASEEQNRGLVTFDVASVGFVFAGRAKGVAYVEEPASSHPYLRLVPIVPGWWIYEEAYD